MGLDLVWLVVIVVVMTVEGLAEEPPIGALAIGTEEEAGLPPTRLERMLVADAAEFGFAPLKTCQNIASNLKEHSGDNLLTFRCRRDSAPFHKAAKARKLSGSPHSPALLLA